jgi:hypothetical protein
MDIHNYFFCFVRYSRENFQEKKIGTITKESRKIRANCKNDNFSMHSRS